MDWGIDFILGLAAGLIAARFARVHSAAPAPPAPAPNISEAPAIAAEPEEETLTAKLRRLNERLDAAGRDAAHANELAGLPSFREAVALLSNAKTPLSSVTDYAFGQTWTLSCAAFAALEERADGKSAAADVPRHFDNFAAWQMHFALKFLRHLAPDLPAGAPLLGYRDWWADAVPVQRVFADHFGSLDEDNAAELGPGVENLPVAHRAAIKSFLERVRHPLAQRLADKILKEGEDFSAHRGTGLATIGRFWDAKHEAASLVAPAQWQDAIDASVRLIIQRPPRSLLVAGEALCGKSSFLRLTAERLAASGWRVFEASAADLQAGQQYIGQLEGRIRQVLDELDIRNKIIWYIPDLLACALSGTHQGQSASVLDQIMPALSAGRIIVLSEATPASLARLIQLRPGLGRALEIARLETMTPEEAKKIAGSLSVLLAKDSGFSIDPSFSRVAIEAASQYLSASSLPGSALGLMRLTAMRLEKSKRQNVSGHDILETLSQMTGLPLSLLDGAERLELAGVSRFFSDRVIGQPEAVASIVERIAMLKSGLNDPGKPIGVLLFAGPTGTGKTELAKAAAEYLFGSADRMIRLDMSEYQSYDAVSKILGGGGLPPDADTLVSRIRKQPFSLLLLDEFEKAHTQIWDLFLQVFDEGRLTDAFGQTADFRHCLVILTSNLGATAHRASGGSMGFAPIVSDFAGEQVMKAIGQAFRPEFQNRLDKVIVFKPLTRDLMRGILKKELGRIFERRGLKDRAWAVEWDVSALEFLLEKGFTPEMGARPLKRAIDQHLIAPLAALIVERRLPEGDQFVFVRREGQALKAEFVDPDGEGTPQAATAGISTSAAPHDLLAMMRHPEGSRAEAEALGRELDPATERIQSAEWDAQKSALAEAVNTPDFWSKLERFSTLMRLGLMDRVAVAAETAHSLHGRLIRSRPSGGKSARDLVARLAMQIHLVNEGILDLDNNTPAEIAVAIEAAFDSKAEEGAAEAAWCRDIAAMYKSWAEKRNMALTQVAVADHFPAPVLLVSGFSAWRTLQREAGLHILDGIESDTTSSRMTARVLVAPVPPGDLSQALLRQALLGAFSKVERSTAIVRRYRRGPSPLVRNGDGSWRSGKADEVLGGDFDILVGR